MFNNKRPRFDHLQVETRLLSPNPYSIKWHVWGSTFFDMLDASKRIAQPWSALRALGIFYSSKRNFGWDFITVQSIRLANDDGYTDDDLHKFLKEKNKNILRYIPNFLLGRVPGFDDSNTKNNEIMWHKLLFETFLRCQRLSKKLNFDAYLPTFQKFFKFLLPKFLMSQQQNKTIAMKLFPKFILGTLMRCEYVMERLNIFIIGAYLYIVAFLNVVLFIATRLFVNKEKKSSFNRKYDYVFLRALVRLLITHGLILLLAHTYVNRIEQTSWAKNIRAGRMYQPYDINNATNRDVYISDEALAATYPLTTDVLVSARFNSQYLGSYNELFDVSHPGNRKWNELIKENTDGCYNKLPTVLKRHICTNIVTKMKSIYHGRFLIQNKDSDWIEQTREESKRSTHHKLMMLSNPYIREINTQIEFLRSECRFGFLRSTGLHRKYIPQLLANIQRRVLHENEKKAQDSSSRFHQKWKKSSLFSFPLISTKTITTHDVLPAVVTVEPFEGAWLKVGDAVEAKHKAKNDVLYKGRIIRTNSFNETGIYVVQFDNGIKQFDLPADFIRRLKPIEESKKKAHEEMPELSKQQQPQSHGENVDAVDDLNRNNKKIPKWKLRQMERQMEKQENIHNKNVLTHDQTATDNSDTSQKTTTR